MEYNKELKIIVDSILERLKNKNLTVQYAMSIVTAFKSELEDELSEDIIVDYDVIFIEEHYKVISILNDATLAAMGSQNIGLERTILYTMIFQFLLTACLKGDMKIIMPAKEDDNDDFSFD